MNDDKQIVIHTLTSLFLLPIEAKDLISWMLAIRPRERPTLEQILSHPWIRGPSNVLQLHSLPSSPRMMTKSNSVSSTPVSSPGNSPALIHSKPHLNHTPGVLLSQRSSDNSPALCRKLMVSSDLSSKEGDKVNKLFARQISFQTRLV